MSKSSNRTDPAVILDLGEGRDGVASVAVGEHLEIDLTSPGTTGYLWELDADEQQSRLISRAIASDERTFGGRGRVRFVVQPLQPGIVELRLRLRAQWEEAPIREHHVRLQVHQNPGGN